MSILEKVNEMTVSLFMSDAHASTSSYHCVDG